MHHSRSEFLTGASALEATADPPGCPAVGAAGPDQWARAVAANADAVAAELRLSPVLGRIRDRLRAAARGERTTAAICVVLHRREGR
jgi:hypothetical protein